MAEAEETRPPSAATTEESDSPAAPAEIQEDDCESNNSQEDKKNQKERRNKMEPYPDKETFKEREFPRGLKHYGIFPITGMWTDEDMSIENRATYSYSKDVPTIDQMKKKVEDNIKKLSTRSDRAFNHPMVSPVNGEKIDFFFDLSNKPEDIKCVEIDVKRSIWHISQYVPEIRKEIEKILGIRKLRVYDDLADVDLSDYRGRMGDVVAMVNTIVEDYRQGMAGKGLGVIHSLDTPDSIWKGNRMSTDLAAHVISGVLSRVIVDGTYLNKTYKGFSSCVYGETSLIQLEEFARELDLTEEDVIVDLGSGVGNVCMFFAAACNVNKVVGIEINETPARVADKALVEFNKAVKWYGKNSSPIYLEHADFTHRRFKDFITKEATLIFVNNFAFDQKLTKRISDMIREIEPRANGRKVRIISTKAFACVTEDGEKVNEDPETGRKMTSRRNRTEINNRRAELHDLTCILQVRKLNKVTALNCSWTGKEVHFYIHTLDWSKLERYYNKQLELKNMVKNGEKPVKDIEKSDNILTDSLESSDSEEYADDKGVVKEKGYNKATKGGKTKAVKQESLPEMRRARGGAEKVDKDADSAEENINRNGVPRGYRLQKSSDPSAAKDRPALLANGQDNVNRMIHTNYLTSIAFLEYLKVDGVVAGLHSELEAQMALREENLARVEEMDAEIKGMLVLGVRLLNSRLAELGMSASNPTDILNQSKDIVNVHKDLTLTVSHLEKDCVDAERNLIKDHSIGHELIERMPQLDVLTATAAADPFSKQDVYGVYIGECIASSERKAGAGEGSSSAPCTLPPPVPLVAPPVRRQRQRAPRHNRPSGGKKATTPSEAAIAAQATKEEENLQIQCFVQKLMTDRKRSSTEAARPGEAKRKNGNPSIDDAPE